LPLTKDGRRRDQTDWPLFVVLVAAPISSLLALWGRIDDTWPFVYFQGKTLEEKKIEALNAGRKP
jgi:uncharacterized membrane protein YhhN